MKTQKGINLSIIFSSCFILATIQLCSQNQLSIEGMASSLDTVAEIKVGYSGSTDVVGLHIYSKPQSSYGIGLNVEAGYRAIEATSDFSDAIHGTSSIGNGVFGESLNSGGAGIFGRNINSGFAGYFEGQLGVDGDLILEDFAGVGPGALHVNASGVVELAPVASIPKIYSYNIHSAMSANNDFIHYSTAYFGSNTVGVIHVPVYLPHGEDIKHLKFWFRDNSTSDYEVQLIRQHHETYNFSALGIVTITGVQSSSNMEYILVASSSFKTVDNENYVYYIRARAIAPDLWESSFARLGNGYIELE